MRHPPMWAAARVTDSEDRIGRPPARPVDRGAMMPRAGCPGARWGAPSSGLGCKRSAPGRIASAAPGTSLAPRYDVPQSTRPGLARPL